MLTIKIENYASKKDIWQWMQSAETVQMSIDEKLKMTIKLEDNINI